MTWQAVLKNPKAGTHIAQLYQQERFLCRSVAVYISAGIKKGDAVVLVATPEHTASFRQDLKTNGFDAEALQRAGQLIILDAETTLSSFSAEGEPIRERFTEVVGGVIERAGKDHLRVRAFGEMVNLLWQRGDLSKAIALEEMWNDLAKRHSFALFCAYIMDNFNPEMHHGPLQNVCKTHSHLIPAADYGLLERSVSKAVEDIFGSDQASRLFLLVTLQGRHLDRFATMPTAQQALLWLRGEYAEHGRQGLDAEPFLL